VASGYVRKTDLIRVVVLDGITHVIDDDLAETFF
jgi:hypothetical protein